MIAFNIILIIYYILRKTGEFNLYDIIKMSARAMASQKAKRATGSNGQSSTPPPNPDIQANDSSEKTKLTISEAIYMIDNKLTVIENDLAEIKNVDNKQSDTNSNEVIKTLKLYEDRMAKLEKDNSLLKLKLTQLETSIPSIRSSIQNLETKSSTYDTKVVDIEEMQKLVNKISTQLLNKE